MRHYIYLFFAVLMMLGVSGCDLGDKQMNSCDGKIPLYADFNKNPIFAALHYRKRIEIENGNIFSQKGYDLWADSKFSFRSGLQFDFIRQNKASQNKVCVNNASLRLALPLGLDQKKMLSTFVNEVAQRIDMNANQLNEQLNKLLADNGEYHLIDKNNSVTISAGIAHHQFRGDFFVLAVESNVKDNQNE